MPYFCTSVCLCCGVMPLYLFSGVLVTAEADPLAELQWAPADQSPTPRREGTVLHCQVLRAPSVFLLTSPWHSAPLRLLVVFQYDSDGSDSQESSEEAELRRKKIEALKVSVSQFTICGRVMMRSNKTEHLDCEMTCSAPSRLPPLVTGYLDCFNED